MREVLLSWSLALLFLAAAVPSFAQKTEEPGVSIASGAPLTIECSLRVEQRVDWKKDGGPIPSDMKPAGESPAGAGDGHVIAKLKAPKARSQHAGVYTCSYDRNPKIRVNIIPSALTATDDGAVQVVDADADVLYYNVTKNLNLVCPFTNDEKAVHVWKKNGTDIGAIEELKGRYEYHNGTKIFFIKRALEDDFGNYSCLIDGQNKTWVVRGNPHPKVPDNSNVVEGQPLKLNCKIIGKPYTKVSWRYGSDANYSTAEDVTNVFEDRVVLQPNDQHIEDGQLLIKEARKSDAGYYFCSMGTEMFDTTQLRVKDMYAALWPFLGICAEVFILCAIILIYEKRRTKPEMEDSDTDNHDQKKA